MNRGVGDRCDGGWDQCEMSSLRWTLIHYNRCPPSACVRFLVGELRARKPRGGEKKKKGHRGKTMWRRRGKTALWSWSQRLEWRVHESQDSREHWQPAKAQRGKDGVSFQTSEGRVAGPHLDFGLPASRNGRWHVCRFKYVQHMVLLTASPGN